MVVRRQHQRLWTNELLSDLEVRLMNEMAWQKRNEEGQSPPFVSSDEECQLLVMLNVCAGELVHTSHIQTSFELLKHAERISDPSYVSRVSAPSSEHLRTVALLRAITYASYANYFRKKNKTNAALRCLLKGLKIHNKYHDRPEATARTHLSIATILAQMGESKTSAEHNKFAVKTLQSVEKEQGRSDNFFPHLADAACKDYEEEDEIPATRHHSAFHYTCAVAYHNLAVDDEASLRFSQSLDNFSLAVQHAKSGPVIDKLLLERVQNARADAKKRAAARLGFASRSGGRVQRNAREPVFEVKIDHVGKRADHSRPPAYDGGANHNSSVMSSRSSHRHGPGRMGRGRGSSKYNSPYEEPVGMMNSHTRGHLESVEAPQRRSISVPDPPSVLMAPYPRPPKTAPNSGNGRGGRRVIHMRAKTPGSPRAQTVTATSPRSPPRARAVFEAYQSGRKSLPSPKKSPMHGGSPMSFGSPTSPYSPRSSCGPRSPSSRSSLASSRAKRPLTAPTRKFLSSSQNEKQVPPSPIPNEFPEPVRCQDSVQRLHNNAITLQRVFRGHVVRRFLKARQVKGELEAIESENNELRNRLYSLMRQHHRQSRGRGAPLKPVAVIREEEEHPEASPRRAPRHPDESGGTPRKRVVMFADEESGKEDSLDENENEGAEGEDGSYSIMITPKQAKGTVHSTPTCFPGAGNYSDDLTEEEDGEDCDEDAVGKDSLSGGNRTADSTQTSNTLNSMASPYAHLKLDLSCLEKEDEEPMSPLGVEPTFDKDKRGREYEALGEPAIATANVSTGSAFSFGEVNLQGKASPLQDGPITSEMRKRARSRRRQRSDAGRIAMPQDTLQVEEFQSSPVVMGAPLEFKARDEPEDIVAGSRQSRRSVTTAIGGSRKRSTHMATAREYAKQTAPDRSGQLPSDHDERDVLGIESGRSATRVASSCSEAGQGGCCGSKMEISAIDDLYDESRALRGGPIVLPKYFSAIAEDDHHMVST